MRLFFLMYDLLIYCFTPFFILRLKWKSRLNKAYGQRIKERFGFYNEAARSSKHDIWLHAVSFGEAEVAKGLIEKWLGQGKKIIVTTTTPTGSARIQALFGQSVTHVYLPFEWPGAMSRFLHKFPPKLLVIMETELWPNLLRYSHQHGIKIIITNARLSEKSMRGYAYIRPVIRHVLSYVTKVIAQTKADGERFVQLGLPLSQMMVGGNLKFDAPTEGIEQDKIEQKRLSLFSKRSVWIAASTHPGEEALILRGYQQLKKSIKDIVLIIALRHPERTKEVTKLIHEHDFAYCCRTDQRALTADEDVFLLNTLGELQLFYHLSDIAFIGGSLVPHGGHNVLEAIRADVPVVVGKHMHNFQFMADELLKAGGMVQVEDEKQLAQQVIELLSNSERQADLEKSAKHFLEQHTGALDINIAEIAQY